MSSKERTFASTLWDFFCSLKLTIVTLILLAATSIIGTVLPQDMGKAAEFKKSISEPTYRLFDTLGFFDMYHSWWFLALLGIFSLNLIACSIKRLPKVWKAVHEPILVADDAFLKTLANLDELLVKSSSSQAAERAGNFLGARFARPVVTEQDGKIYLYAQKAAWARFGVYVTHFSILLIFVGAIIGSVWGYKAYVNIVEGTETAQVWPRGSDQPIDLGFAVRCEEFSVSYYPNSMRPKEFRSVLTVSEGGQTIIDKRPIVVNSPLTYRGITFYQSSYGPAGEASFSFQVRKRDSGETTTLRAPQGRTVPLPGGGSFRVVDFTDNDPRFGLAAQVEVTTATGDRSYANIFKEFPNFDERRGGAYIFTLLDFKQRYYTGLQVAKDPGVWVVWAGCFLMVVGSMVAFFLSHRRIWVVLVPNGEKTLVKIGGSAHRNQPAFEIFFDELKKSLKNELAS